MYFLLDYHRMPEVCNDWRSTTKQQSWICIRARSKGLCIVVDLSLKSMIKWSRLTAMFFLLLQLSHESQVRGQVALRFFGADNKEYLLTRTVEGKLAKGAKVGNLRSSKSCWCS